MEVTFLAGTVSCNKFSLNSEISRRVRVPQTNLLATSTINSYATHSFRSRLWEFTEET